MPSLFKHQPKFKKAKERLQSKKASNATTPFITSPKSPSPSTPKSSPSHTSTSDEEAETHCPCTHPDSDTMLGCDNPICEHEWFHPKCLGIIKMPAEDEAWFCPMCRDLANVEDMIEGVELRGERVGGYRKVNLDGLWVSKGRGEEN